MGKCKVEGEWCRGIKVEGRVKVPLVTTLGDTYTGGRVRERGEREG